MCDNNRMDMLRNENSHQQVELATMKNKLRERRSMVMACARPKEASIHKNDTISIKHVRRGRGR